MINTGSTWNKFKLAVLRYPRRQFEQRRIDGRWYTGEQLRDRKVLQGFGFNAREVDFLVKHGLYELSRLYLDPYIDAIKDEYQPFGVGLDELDHETLGQVLERAGASDAAFRFCARQAGRRRSGRQRLGRFRSLFHLAIGHSQAPRPGRVSLVLTIIFSLTVSMFH